MPAKCRGRDSGTVLGVMSMAIEQQRQWVTLDPVTTDEETGRARHTYAAMDTTQLILQRLTSGIYRAALEQFYFEHEYQRAVQREQAIAATTPAVATANRSW